MEFIDHVRRDGQFPNRQPVTNAWQLSQNQNMDSVVFCQWNLLTIFDEMDIFPTVNH